MGMFDYVKCEYQLPGNVPLNIGEINFQTKDFDCSMVTYTITTDGELFLFGERVDFTGDVSFYESNVVESGPGTYTKNGEDSYWLEYQVIFIDGKITHARLVNYETSPSMKSSVHCYPPEGFANEDEREQWWREKRKEFDDYVKAELERRASTSQKK